MSSRWFEMIEITSGSDIFHSLFLTPSSFVTSNIGSAVSFSSRSFSITISGSEYTENTGLIFALHAVLSFRRSLLCFGKVLSWGRIFLVEKSSILTAAKNPFLVSFFPPSSNS